MTTVEIKSGYGLDLDTERRMLQAARLAAQAAGMRVHTTFLGLHALPPELDRATYLEQVIEHWLPTLHAEGLVDAVDAFCESIAFTAAECARRCSTRTGAGRADASRSRKDVRRMRCRT